MLALTLAVLVAAAPAQAPAPAPRLLVMDLKADQGVDPQTATTLTDFLAAWVTESRKFSVTSKRELTTLADLEAQRQEADCEASDVCVSDLADALGARFVVFGRVGKLGASWFVHVTLADAKGEVPSDRRVVQAASVDELAVLLHDAARQMTGAVPLARAAPVTKTTPPTPPRTTPPTTPTSPATQPASTTPASTSTEPARPVRDIADDPQAARDRRLQASAAAQQRTSARKAEAAALRGEFDTLSTVGSASLAGGLVVGGAATIAGFALPSDQRASLQPVLCGGSLGACAIGGIVGTIFWVQALDKKDAAEEIDPMVGLSP